MPPICGMATKKHKRHRIKLRLHFALRSAFSSFLCAFLWLLLCVPFAAAHNPDTSYTRIKLSASELETKFTLDLFTLRMITPLDANRDGSVSKAELLAKAPVIFDYLRRHVKLALDGHATDFGEGAEVLWPEDTLTVPEKDYHQALVHFVFRRELIGPPEEIHLLYDFWNELGDRHVNLCRIEESGKESDEIVFTRLEPDYTYYPALEVRAWPQMLQFGRLGVKHIFGGPDHLMFLLALIVVGRFRDLVLIVSSFTVAHTITLILAALEIVKLPTRLVESGIALTIVYVALENLWAKKTSHRWALTFAFGLVHGFGFANVLRELGLPATGLMRSLVSFNVGVEIGQLAVVALMWTTWRAVVKRLGGDEHKRKPIVVLSVLIFLFGAAWFIERALGLNFMPI